jgi:hypothetical protein
MKAKKDQFGFATPLILAIVGLGIVAVGVIAYFQLRSPTPQALPTPAPIRETSGFTPQSPVSTLPTPDTTGWKVYINKKYSYIINYPARANVTEEENPQGRLFEGEVVDVVDFEYPYLKSEEVIGNTEAEKANFILSQGNLGVKIEVIQNVRSTLRDYAEKSAELLGTGVGGAVVEKINVGVVEGYEVKYKAHLATEIYLKHKDERVIIHISEFHLTQKAQEHLEVFDRMLSSFKFLD